MGPHAFVGRWRMGRGPPVWASPSLERILQPIVLSTHKASGDLQSVCPCSVFSRLCVSRHGVHFAFFRQKGRKVRVVRKWRSDQSGGKKRGPCTFFSCRLRAEYCN